MKLPREPRRISSRVRLAKFDQMEYELGDIEVLRSRSYS